MGEKYYNINGTPTSYDDLFDEYGMQTDVIIKNKGYQQVDKPVSTSIPTETNQPKLETNQVPTTSSIKTSTTFPVIQDGEMLDVESTDKIQKDLESGIKSNRDKYNQLNPQEFENQVELVKNEEAELTKAYEGFEKDNKDFQKTPEKELGSFLLYKTDRQIH